MDHAERARAVGNYQRSAAAARDALDDRLQILGRQAAIFRDKLYDLIGRAFANSMAADIDAAHSGHRGERNEGCTVVTELAAAQAELALGEHDDRSSFGSLVSERRELRGLGEFARFDAGDRE